MRCATVYITVADSKPQQTPEIEAELYAYTLSLEGAELAEEPKALRE